MRRVAFALLAWSVAVAVLVLNFGGGQVAPCLGLGGSPGQLACVARWQAENPPPPALLDPALPWLWLIVWLAGCLTVLVVVRASRF